MELLENAPRFTDCDYVFTTGDKPVSGFSKAKKRLAQLSGIQGGWRLHDLRRTAATGMVELGVHSDTLARVLNHSPGSNQGVTAIYNQHGYTAEKRQAR